MRAKKLRKKDNNKEEKGGNGMKWKKKAMK